MASSLPTSHSEGFSSESDTTIVVLGDSRVDKNKVTKLILGCDHLKGEEFGLCTLYETEKTRRKIIVVKTPGWNSISIEQTEKKVQSAIIRSVSLCPPGPDVVLLIIPIKEPSSTEINSALKHMELLTERVWKHTIVLFDCDEGIEESIIREYIHSTETILKKCQRRHFIFHKGVTQIKDLFEQIDHLMKENNGEIFMPPIYYEKIQTQVSGGSEMRLRCGSLEKIPPDLRKENESEEKKETAKTSTHSFLDDITLSQTIKPPAFILMGIMGAMIGSVAGAEHGVYGSTAGLVFGFIVGCLPALLAIYICTYSYSSKAQK